MLSANTWYVQINNNYQIEVWIRQTGRWQIVSQDICELHNQSFLVTMCHFSDWIEVHKLGDDNRPPRLIWCSSNLPYRYRSTGHNLTVQNVLCGRRFQAHHFVPYHHKGNGRAEAAVKVAESMFKNVDDFHSAPLLNRTPHLKGRHTHLLSLCS